MKNIFFLHKIFSLYHFQSDFNKTIGNCNYCLLYVILEFKFFEIIKSSLNQSTKKYLLWILT